MTVSNTNSRHIYNCNGVLKTWPYTFQITDPTDIEIYLTNSAGVITEITANFEVDEGNGNVIYPTEASGLPAPPTGSKITLLRVVPETQEIDLVTRGPLSAQVLEDGYDKLTLITQQLSEELTRCVKYRKDETVTDDTPETFLSSVEGYASAASASATAAAASETAAASSAVSAAESAAEALSAVFPTGADKQVQFNDGGVGGTDPDFNYDKATKTLAVPNLNGNASTATHADAVTPAGSDTQVQFNDGGALGANSNLTYNKATDTLTVSNLAGNASNGYKTGDVKIIAQSTAPAGFLKCNGADISRTTYAALFAIIGTRFGSGDGSTTFNLPDLRGEFVRGWDDGRGVDSGRTLGSTQADALQGHWHTGDFSDGAAGSLLLYVNSSPRELNNANNVVKDPISDGTHGTPRIASETRPRNIALLFCIKY